MPDKFPIKPILKFLKLFGWPIVLKSDPGFSLMNNEFMYISLSNTVAPGQVCKGQKIIPETILENLTKKFLEDGNE